jgi:hypothetical protein
MECKVRSTVSQLLFWVDARRVAEGRWELVRTRGEGDGIILFMPLVGRMLGTSSWDARWDAREEAPGERGRDPMQRKRALGTKEA